MISLVYYTWFAEGTNWTRDAADRLICHQFFFRCRSPCKNWINGIPRIFCKFLCIVPLERLDKKETKYLTFLYMCASYSALIYNQSIMRVHHIIFGVHCTRYLSTLNTGPKLTLWSGSGQKTGKLRAFSRPSTTTQLTCTPSSITATPRIASDPGWC